MAKVGFRWSSRNKEKRRWLAGESALANRERINWFVSKTIKWSTPATVRHGENTEKECCLPSHPTKVTEKNPVNEKENI